MFHAEPVRLLRVQFTIRYPATQPESLFRIQSAAPWLPFSSFSINKAPTFSPRKRILILNSHAILSAILRPPSAFSICAPLHALAPIIGCTYAEQRSSAFAYDDSLFLGMNLFCSHSNTNTCTISSASVEFHYASSANRVIHQRQDSARRQSYIPIVRKVPSEECKKRMNEEYTFQHKNVHVLLIIVMGRMPPRNARVRAPVCLHVHVLYTNRDMS